jgi:hypothetical protein
MRRICLPLIAILGCLVIAAPARAQGKATLADRVHTSINKGVRYLLNQQWPEGDWEKVEGYANHVGGITALATLALLNAGVPDADRPRVEKALTYLRGLEVNSVYARALQTMALAEASLDPRRDEISRKKDLELIRRNVQWLINARVVKDGRLQGWAYNNTNLLSKNASTSQYAMLGLWAGKQAGIEIKRELWQAIRDYYVREQDPQGGFWIYDKDFGPRNHDLPSITMTTAGLAGLLIAGMELNAGREQLQAGGAINCGAYRENPPLDKGLAWLGQNFTISPANRVFYHLYGVERAGRLSGLRFFGEHDWYREGSDFLVGKQNPEGSWSAPGEFDKYPISSTAFAVLFLSKGRTPVLVSKTVHGNWPRKQLGQVGYDQDWNNDRNDLRNLVQFTSKQLFKGLPLAWQTYDLMWASGGKANLNEDDQAEVVSEMLQSPIFYITGHHSPRHRFTGVEKQLLKRYVESGGFIMAEACCSSPEFDQGFKGLVEDIWGVDAELAYLDGGHAVWSSHFAITPGEPYKLMGLNLGCKTVLVYSPQDMSCFWESGDPEKDGRADRAFKLGANIIAYATGMQPPRPRLTEMTVASNRTPEEKHAARGYFQVAQVHFKGEWKAAPKAMTRLMENVRGSANVDVQFKPIEVWLNDEDVSDYKFLYLHGRVKPGQEPFPAGDELKVLRFNLENGGLLLADACCGDENFDKAFRAFVQVLFPKHKLEQVPLNDVLFSEELNGKGQALTDASIKCRRDRKSAPVPMSPWLEGIKGADGRWMVLYSKYDIGCALEGHQSLGCLGYDPSTAMRLARAAVLYSLRP